MPKPADYIEIFLQPGDFFFGDANTRIRTLLGSCVAITMWHPQRLLGAMCHCLVPTRGHGNIDALDGRYADEAVLMFLQEAIRQDSDPKDYEFKLFGGGNMFPGVIAPSGGGAPVGARNVERVRELLETFHLPLAAENTGSCGHRIVMLDCWSGNVWLRHEQMIKKEQTRFEGERKDKVA